MTPLSLRSRGLTPSRRNLLLPGGMSTFLPMRGKHTVGVQGSVAIHGHTVNGRRSKTFCSWANMIQRCNNPKNPYFKNYGARGISIHERYLSFENFLEDLGEKPENLSLDRIDNERGYEPENLRWADRTTQQRNRRSNHLITAFGRTQPLTAWAYETGFKIGTIRTRLASGWPPEKALAAPLQKMGRPRVHNRLV